MLLSPVIYLRHCFQGERPSAAEKGVGTLYFQRLSFTNHFYCLREDLPAQGFWQSCLSRTSQE